MAIRQAASGSVRTARPWAVETTSAYASSTSSIVRGGAQVNRVDASGSRCLAPKSTSRTTRSAPGRWMAKCAQPGLVRGLKAGHGLAAVPGSRPQQYWLRHTGVSNGHHCLIRSTTARGGVDAVWTTDSGAPARSSITGCQGQGLRHSAGLRGTLTKVMEQHLVAQKGLMADFEQQVREVQSIRAVLAYDIRDFDRRACRPASTTATRHHEVHGLRGRPGRGRRAAPGLPPREEP